MGEHLLRDDTLWAPARTAATARNIGFRSELEPTGPRLLTGKEHGSSACSRLTGKADRKLGFLGAYR